MEILGQDKVIKQIKNFIAGGRMPPALVFYGPKGVGKATAVAAMAKILNCQDVEARKNITFCGNCVSCSSIDKGIHPDFVFADFLYQANLTGKELDKQQRIGVDTIRSITAKSQQRAVIGPWKIMAVDSAETMSLEAANALLKFIEEPPPQTVWVLVTSRKSALLPTILSRSQSLAFGRLPDEVLGEILRGQGVNEAVLEQAVVYGEGSVDKALKAAAVLELFAGEDASAPSFPYEAAASLNKTLALARNEAVSLLDILHMFLAKKWRAETDETKKDILKKKTEKTAFFKKAVKRNVSPALVIETALMENDKILDEVFN